jgi:hypothetical protein
MSDIDYIMFELESAFIETTVLSLLGGEQYYSMSENVDVFNTMFNRKPSGRILVKAVKHRMGVLGLTFEEFTKYCCEVFEKLSYIYPFDERNESLTINPMSSTYLLNVATTMEGVFTGSDDGFFERVDVTVQPVWDDLIVNKGKFFYDFYGNIFNVPLNVREHLLQTHDFMANNVGLMLEPWLYLKYVQHDWSVHSNSECVATRENFNRVYAKNLVKFNVGEDELNIEDFKHRLQKPVPLWRKTLKGDWEYVYNDYKRGFGFSMSRRVITDKTKLLPFSQFDEEIRNIYEAVSWWSLCRSFSCFPVKNVETDLMLEADLIFQLVSFSYMSEEGASIIAGKIVNEDFYDNFNRVALSLTKMLDKEKFNVDEVDNIVSFDEALMFFKTSANAEIFTGLKDLPATWLDKIL